MRDLCNDQVPTDGRGLPRPSAVGGRTPEPITEVIAPTPTPTPNESDRDALPQALPVGFVVAGRFEVLAAIGTGGMGAVYHARDRASGKNVALKVMTPMPFSRGLMEERFQREADILKRLSHPGIVEVVDTGDDTARGLKYIAMEMVDGVTLRAWIDARRKDRRTIPVALVLDMAEQTLGALQYAHDTTIHRDVKPDNIIVVREDPIFLKLIDFGIAWFRYAAPVTATGVVLGTPHYMAPEQQIDASRVDERADLYALSVIIYELLTFRRPVGRFKLPSELRPNLPAALDNLVLRGLAAEPEDRWASAAEMFEDIRAARRACEAATESADEFIPGSGSEARQRDFPWTPPPR